MKRFAVLILGLVMGGYLLAAPPAVEKVKRSYHMHSKRYAQGEYFALRNDLSNYLVYLQWTKATAKKSEQVYIGLPEPNFWYGFIARDFVQLKINDINSHDLIPKSMTPFSDAQKAGVDILYNFDGIRMTMRFFMNAQSALLGLELIPDPANEDPINQMELVVNANPCFVLNNGGKRDAAYQRCIVTPVRELSFAKGTGWKYLRPTENSLVLLDKNEAFQPPRSRKGPCVLAMDWNGIRSGRVWFGQIYCMKFEFKLNPQVKSWHFGFYEAGKLVTNQEFLSQYKNNSARFSLPLAQ